MTSPEHTLVGILGAFSVGLHRRLGWPAVVMAAVASNIPDFDGIPMLFDMERFETGHRVWGHNALAILITSVLVAFSQYQFRWIEKISWRLNHLLPSETAIECPDAVRRIDFISLLVICVCFQSIHLICDITVSGGSGLSNWEVKPLWPFNHTGVVFPLIPWGDVGPTVIMMLGVIAIAKLQRVGPIAASTLVLLCVYMLCRGYVRGVVSL